MYGVLRLTTFTPVHVSSASRFAGDLLLHIGSMADEGLAARSSLLVALSALYGYQQAGYRAGSWCIDPPSRVNIGVPNLFPVCITAPVCINKFTHRHSNLLLGYRTVLVRGC